MQREYMSTQESSKADAILVLFFSNAVMKQVFKCSSFACYISLFYNVDQQLFCPQEDNTFMVTNLAINKH